MALYGHEISAELNVFEAGLDRYCKLEKGPFVGSEALAKIKAEGGPKRKLVGLEVIERGIARDGYGVFDGEGNADRLRHQRLARSVSQEEHCAGLCAARLCRRRFRSRCAVSIEPGARQSRSAPFLPPPKKAGLAVDSSVGWSMWKNRSLTLA